jgi:hypothetical protein
MNISEADHLYSSNAKVDMNISDQLHVLAPLPQGEKCFLFAYHSRSGLVV